MVKEKRMERNLNGSIRITEIPPEGEIQELTCPFCKFPLPVGKVKDGKINGATSYCKRCKRKLRIAENN